MADMNHVVLVGRLTRDAELKYANSGLAIAKLSLAVNSRVKRDDTWQEEGNFFDAVFMGRGAEAVAQYLVKGKQIAIHGELRQNRWEQEGQRRSRVEIFVRDLQLLGGGGGGGGGGAMGRSQGYPSSGGPEGGGPEGGPGPEGGRQNDRGYGGREAPMADDFDDDIPF
ncbi:MAG: single-stranded DNA-binding protein [Spirochaetales bacterium]|nr:single-stranded DNA-binding protein [Spirochaetales bacterium]